MRIPRHQLQDDLQSRGPVARSKLDDDGAGDFLETRDGESSGQFLLETPATPNPFSAIWAPGGFAGWQKPAADAC